jgi:4-hydroxy-4-methyl-2-oxoglutarate aldolase
MNESPIGSKGSASTETSATGRGDNPRTEPLDAKVLEALRGLDAGTLANAIETFQKRLRNEGFVDHTVHCFCPSLKPMVGYAATLRIRGSAPPTAGGAYADRTDWWNYVLTLPAPRVAVVQDIAARPGLGALIGAVHMNILRALQCVGVVTNGAVRDLPAAESAGFHYFAGGLSVSHAYEHIVEFGSAVEIGGLKIQSGDLLHGDAHGVQSIPLDIAAQIPPVAAQIAAKEQAIIDLCRSPNFSLEGLRALIAKG